MWPERGRIASLTVLLLAAPAVARAADEASLQLADGPGRELVQSRCAMCHSVDYIIMNSPFQDTPAWEKTVSKMIKVYGAPLSAEDAAAIVSYLGERYGKQRD